MRHSANLDALRAFAVTAVLVDHLVPTIHLHNGFNVRWVIWFASFIGHAGVLAFFVHTSLVLMYSLERMHADLPNVTWKFYVRRFFRIYPLAVFAVLLVLTLHLPGATWRPPEAPTRAVIIANLLLVQNIFTRHEILGPLWSLPYEVQMYLVLPLLWAVARWRRAVPTLLALYALICVAGIFVAHRSGHVNMFAYAPCFLCGVLCYALRHRQKAWLPAAGWVPFILALFAVSEWCNVSFPSPWHTQPPAFWIGWIFCLLLGLSINLFRDGKSAWFNWITHYVAQYSYGMYLLHVPMLYLVFLYWHMQHLALAVPLFFLLTTAASIATFHIIEGPFIDLGRRLSSRRAPRPGATREVVPAP